MALDPLAEEVACEGYFGLPGQAQPEAPLPANPAQRALCEAARKVSAGRALSRE